MLKKKTWDKATDKNIELLHPLLRAKARFFVNYLEEEKIFIRIYSTLRTFEQQNELYKQGREIPGKKVTNAKGGQSYHNYGLAFDCVEIRNSEAIWENDKWEYISKVAGFFGFEWGGYFTNPDKPHFQMTFGLHWQKLIELNKGYKPDGYINLNSYL